MSQPRPQAFPRLSSDSVRLGAEHDSLSSMGDVTFDFLPRKTGNEAAHVVFFTVSTRIAVDTQFKTAL